MTAIRVFPLLSPRIIEILPPTTSITVQDLYDLIRQWEQEPANMSFSPLVEGSGKQALGGGVMVGITLKLLNTRVMFRGQTTPLVVGGTCTVDNVNGTLLTASGVDFVAAGVYPGCTVFNYTTRSMASVIEVLSTTQLRSFEISGGTRTTWLIGDSVIVYPNVQCDVGGGNLVAVDELGNEMSAIYQSPNVQILKTSSSSATLTDTAIQEELSYQGMVSIDTTLGVPGTDFPVGTSYSPVSNLADARVIADKFGFRNFAVRGAIVLDQEFAGYNFDGGSILANDQLSINGKDVEGCHLKWLTVSGTVPDDSSFDATQCHLVGVHNITGNFVECCLAGDIELDDGTSNFVCCYSKSFEDLHLDLSKSGSSAHATQWSGPICLHNMTGPSQVVDLYVVSGFIRIEVTCTDGTINIAGMCWVVDETTGGCTIQREAQIEAIAIGYGGVVTIDVNSGEPGTLYPIGSPRRPVNNITDARIIAEESCYYSVVLSGTIALNAAFDRYSFTGQRSVLRDVVDLNGQSIDGSRFELVTITGAMLGGAVQLKECIVSDIEGVDIVVVDSALAGTLKLGDTGSSLLAKNCTLMSYPTVFDMDNKVGYIGCQIEDGQLRIDNAITGCVINITMTHGTIELSSSCTGGTAILQGGAKVTNNSNMTVVVESQTIDILENTNRLLGLAHENAFIDSAEYDENNQMVSARLRIFDSAVHAEAATDGGSETDGLVATYLVTADYESMSKMKTYLMVLGD